MIYTFASIERNKQTYNHILQQYWSLKFSVHLCPASLHTFCWWQLMLHPKVSIKGLLGKSYLLPP